MTPTLTPTIPVGEITPISVGEAIKDSKGNGTTITLKGNTIMNPNAEYKAVNVVMIEEAPIQEKKVEAEAISNLPLLRPKSSNEKPKPLSNFLEVFACLEVNMPLLKNLREMPAYVHSMKELLLKKKYLKK
ncbi:hypothetical protein PIB30_087563 [Stylosanthes scabra]|uniref:Reverse transcriptase domain-containing protein n=1 Tax=Stylosanthes scabra TaxID=79078 RepID=A0ABU6UUA5_9FABA|nr:hypothetical protein [Stylosanthes scabra]